MIDVQLRMTLGDRVHQIAQLSIAVRQCGDVSVAVVLIDRIHKRLQRLSCF